MMGASRGLFVAVLLAKVGIEVLTFPVVTFAIMIYGAIGFYFGIDLPSEASYRSQANGSLDESIPRIKWIERLSGAGTFFAALAAFVSVRNIVVDGDPRGLWTLVVGCGWLVGVTMQIIAGANCAPGPEFVRRLVRFSKQRSHVRIVSGAPEKQVPGVPGLWRSISWSWLAGIADGSFAPGCPSC
jgi:hypothetical protein